MTAQLPYDPDTIDLDAIFKRLHLANARRAWRDLVARAEAEGWSHRTLLAILLAEETAHRRNTRLQRGVRDAGFPFVKTIDDFDFSLQGNLRLPLLGSYLGPELVTEGRNLVLFGKTGRGKTHLAVAIAYKAIQGGFTARFITAAALIDDLSAASRAGRLRDALAAYTTPHVLVIDEVGYLTYGNDAANVLFHVVNDRHTRKRPMIFTTNKSPLTDWGDALHDRDLADAIVDRVLERGRLLVLDGPSYRTRHIPVDTTLTPGSDPARVSGNHRPEFPEPAGPGVGSRGSALDLRDVRPGAGRPGPGALGGGAPHLAPGKHRPDHLRVQEVARHRPSPHLRQDTPARGDRLLRQLLAPNDTVPQGPEPAPGKQLLGAKPPLDRRRKVQLDLRRECAGRP